MTQHLVLTIIGDDRLGLVEAVSNVVAEHEGNWGESRMAHLADKFAGIVTVEVSKAQEEALVAALQGLSAVGLKITAERAQNNTPEGEQLVLSVMGNDRRGIVRQVAQTLNQLGASVTDLSSFCEPAPMSSEMLFKAEIEIILPPQTSLATLEQAIEDISSDLVVELVD